MFYPCFIYRTVRSMPCATIGGGDFVSNDSRRTYPLWHSRRGIDFTSIKKHVHLYKAARRNVALPARATTSSSRHAPFERHGASFHHKLRPSPLCIRSTLRTVDTHQSHTRWAAVRRRAESARAPRQPPRSPWTPRWMGHPRRQPARAGEPTCISGVQWAVGSAGTLGDACG